jgi:hypothetical protein
MSAQIDNKMFRDDDPHAAEKHQKEVDDFNGRVDHYNKKHPEIQPLKHYENGGATSGPSDE